MGLLLLVTTLLGTALMLSAFLAWKSVGDGGMPGCGPGSGCDAVTSSRWAKLGPIPVAALGAWHYLLMLMGWIWLRWTEASPLYGIAQPAMVVLAVAAVGAAVWFVGLQLVVIRRMCRYCMVTQAAGVAASGLILWAASSSGEHVAVPMLGLLGIGAGLVGLLAGGQALIVPKTYRVSELCEVPESAPPKESEGAAPPELAVADPPAREKIVLAKGRVVVSPGDWPLLGRPEAEHLLVSVFDYTCADCRHVHGLLMEVLRQHPQRIALLAVPVPLEPACNPLVLTRSVEQANACVYARHALAVWLARPKAFAAYDQWLFSSPRPPSISEARAKAEQLVGTSALGSLLAGPRVEAKLRDAVELYRAVGGGKVPKLLLPQAVLWGRIPSVTELMRVLTDQLAISGTKPRP